jgi:hypothetical protein
MQVFCLLDENTGYALERMNQALFKKKWWSFLDNNYNSNIAGEYV